MIRKNRQRRLLQYCFELMREKCKHLPINVLIHHIYRKIHSAYQFCLKNKQTLSNAHHFLTVHGCTKTPSAKPGRMAGTRRGGREMVGG